ncbi:hypothetical protein CI109_100422 [Kwoniella shandongensis]|uniref:Uncharacterized protein n=1 Tax=Kwoniella shandongensis TaxID=1734106 RepID=A0A5M6C489_9TREE|nr:uncharacterized protein CI109_001733 [Kwoniella shandongensis]KAA5529793.1 hypothetical protein CI109_001733 [Kwoniella shandongensis]
MKYLLNFLENIPDAPNLSDPEFQQLLVDVQAGKASNKSTADAFYDSLEKIANELKSSPESLAFQKPVSKRDAPDYYEVIKKPMDLSTILRNIKARKYKNKAEFASDLNLIWSNCYEYNSQESHPLRAAARYMKQKADHHLEFLVDKNERPPNPLQALLPQATPTQAGPTATTTGSGPRSPSRAGDGSGPGVPGGDEDAAGESDDAVGEGEGGEEFFREGGAGAQAKAGGEKRGASNGVGRNGENVASGSRANGLRPNGIRRPSPPAFRPKLQTTLDATPALIRTPYTMTHFLPVSLNQAGPSFSDKGKAREILYGNAPPPWYPAPVTTDDEDVKLEGYWWGAMTGDEAYIGGLPAVPSMVASEPPRRRKIRRKSASTVPRQNGIDHPPTAAEVARNGVSLSPTKSPKKLARSKPTKPVSLKKVIHQTVDKLHDARTVIHRIQEFQRVEAEGGILPSRSLETEEEKATKEEERLERRQKRREERTEARKREKEGAEVGEEEAVFGMKKAAAGMLAHAGFEGANETALDLFTRVAVDHLHNMGRTFRLLLDGFSHKMTPEEMVLHAMHENGQLETQHLESHLKDEIERESAKVAEMQRKIRQAFKEVATAPVIGDDMMFADNGEMLLDGNFADELGEDFLGLRDLGIDKEFGLSSLTVPSSVFYGRRKRLADASQNGSKEDQLDYPPPPPFIPLNESTYRTQVPALLHSFYASRLESGTSLFNDDTFPPPRNQIGSLGQIVVKMHSTATTGVPGGGGGGGGGADGGKKKRDRDEEGDKEKKKKALKKTVQPGVGKGNWVRPSKEEKARRAAEKQAREAANGIPNGGVPNGVVSMNGTPARSDDGGEEEDAEGEEEE